MRTGIKSLASILRVLADSIEIGAANAAIVEAADRLEELELQSADLMATAKRLSSNISTALDERDELAAQLKELQQERDQLAAQVALDAINDCDTYANAIRSEVKE